MSEIDTFDLRRAFGSFATGVTIVTTMDARGEACGFTANSFTSVSLAPPLLLVNIAKSAFGLSIFEETRGFAINILSDQQRELSNRFASRGSDKFSGVSWHTKSTGSPLFDGVIAWFDCENFQRVDAGDHVILIGKVLDYSYTSDAPLGFCRGAYVSFGLSPQMLQLVSSTGHLKVGAIIENEGKVLLQRDPVSSEVRIPVADSVGDIDTPDSLLGKFASAGINVQLPFLYAAYGNNDIRYVFYRGELLSLSNVVETSSLFFVEQEDIPWEEMTDSANRMMLTRFYQEHEVGKFAVYVGDHSEGEYYPEPSGK